MDDSSGIPLPRRGVLVGIGGLTVAKAGCLGDNSNGEENVDEGADDVPVQGDEDAPVRLEVYTDFGCPACALYDAQFYADLVETYVDPGDVRYQHRDYVGPVEGEVSWQAASAAREVYLEHGQQFWEYKTRLLDRQDELTENSELYGDISENLGLDSGPIQSAAEDRAHDGMAESDTSRGHDFGIPGRPGFVVDGDVVNPGNVGLAELVDAVRDKLDEALANSEGGG